MSVDHLKKQAKNAQRLLEEFRAAPLGPIKLSQAQEFVARLEGYPDWHAALAKHENEREQPSGAAGSRERDLWMLRYEEDALSDGQRVTTELRIIDGAADALAMLWHSFADFDERQDFPGTPDKLLLALVDNTEVSCTGKQSLELSYQAHRRKIRITLSALDPKVLMLDGPYSQSSSSVVSILGKRARVDDIEALYAAAQEPLLAIQQGLTEYHNANPAKAVSLSIDEHMNSVLKEKATKQGPREGIWNCETWRIGRWRLRLSFFTAADEFYLDIFDEGRGSGSVTIPTNHAAIKRKSSGQWVAGQFKGSEKPLVLDGVPDEVMKDLREAAKDWGIGFVIDGQTEFPPSEQGQAPGHQTFLTWLREKSPDALKGGKYDN